MLPRVISWCRFSSFLARKMGRLSLPGVWPSCIGWPKISKDPSGPFGDGQGAAVELFSLVKGRAGAVESDLGVSVLSFLGQRSTAGAPRSPFDDQCAVHGRLTEQLTYPGVALEHSKGPQPT